MESSIPSSCLFVAVVAVSVILDRKWSSRMNMENSTSSSVVRKVLSKTDVLNLRKKHFMKSVSVSYANSGPLMIVGGEGSRLVDESGRSFLDTRNNVAHVGHGNAYVVEQVQKQLARLNTNTRYLHPLVVQLAQRLVSKMPDPSLEVVIFVNSGSEANDLALRLTRACTESKNTIVVDGAYHGHTLATLEISPYKFEHSREFDLDANGNDSTDRTPGKHIWKVPCPDTYRGKHRDPSTAGTEYAKYVERACDFYSQELGEKVGAFVIEGGMSVGGVILPPKDYLKACVEAVRSAGGVYIADEVQTGFCRFGSSFWAFSHSNNGNVSPDIVTVGKPFGNGMPLGAVITTRSIEAAFHDMGVEYFNTFGGNPVCAAAGLAMLDELENNNLQRNALEIGDYLETKFRDLQSRIDLIGDIRGAGLFLGIELIRDKKTRGPAPEETSYMCTKLKESYNVLTAVDGFFENVIVVKPPLVFSKEDADLFVDSFENAALDLKILGKDVRSMSKTPT